MSEVLLPNPRELRQRTILVRRLIGRVGEEVQMPFLSVEGAVRSGAVEIVTAPIAAPVTAPNVPAKTSKPNQRG